MLKINKTTEVLGIIDSDVLWNNKLSLVAKGIYATIMNINGCSMEMEELYNSIDEKEDIDNAIKELIDNGLIKVEK